MEDKRSHDGNIIMRFQYQFLMTLGNAMIQDGKKQEFAGRLHTSSSHV